jgi:hypothetical protein
MGHLNFKLSTKGPYLMNYQLFVERMREQEEQKETQEKKE